MNYNYDESIVALMVIAGLVGWAFIEGVLWLLSHITIGWGL